MKLRKLAVAALLGTAGLVSMPAIAHAQTAGARQVTVNVPAGDLVAGLRKLGRQARIDIIFNATELRGLRTSGVSGTLSAGIAIERLLAGSGARLVRDPSGAFLVSAVGNGASTEVLAPANTYAAEDDAEITVTGSRIRGAAPSSPVVTLTQQDMKRAGQNNLGEVVRALPQSFSGGQNPGVLGGAQSGNSSNINSTGGSSLNLRGLGPDASLTLLNGNRLPYDSYTQATDVSAIPVAAIDRIEILLDGASAIYGSDAVGGVANIILKRDYDGAEASARYGFATEGGYHQQQYSLVAGKSWSSGGFILTGDYSKSTPVRASQRDYLSYIPYQATTLYPRSKQAGTLFSGHQRLGEDVEVRLDAFYTDRSSDTVGASTASILSTKRDSTIWGIGPSVEYSGLGSWKFRASGFIGSNEMDGASQYYSLATGAPTLLSENCYCNRSESVGFEAEGPLFDLPGGPLRASIGAGYRRNKMKIVNLATGAIAGTAGSDASRYVFGEIRAPLVSPAQDISFIRDLSLNAAVRIEDYDSFGRVATPKFGGVWEVVEGMKFRASWGRSFKVPTLYEQFTERSIYLYSAASFGGPAGMTVMAEGGGNPDLKPEKAEILSLGVTLSPPTARGLTLDVGYFDLGYQNRIASSPVLQFFSAFTNAAYADFVTRNPTVEEQNASFMSFGLSPGMPTGNISGLPYDPATVYGIVHNTGINAVWQKMKGVDVSLRYAFDLGGGQMSTRIDATWIDGKRQLTGSLSPSATTGVAYFPPAFRARGGASWADDALFVSAWINHIGGVDNLAVTPVAKGRSMTTVDLAGGYEVGAGFAANIAVTNLFNADPPYLKPAQPFQVNFDSTNYSPLGRVINLTLTKRF